MLLAKHRGLNSFSYAFFEEVCWQLGRSGFDSKFYFGCSSIAGGLYHALLSEGTGGGVSRGLSIQLKVCTVTCNLAFMTVFYSNNICFNCS